GAVFDVVGQLFDLFGFTHETQAQDFAGIGLFDFVLQFRCQLIELFHLLLDLLLILFQDVLFGAWNRRGLRSRVWWLLPRVLGWRRDGVLRLLGHAAGDAARPARRPQPSHKAGLILHGTLPRNRVTRGLSLALPPMLYSPVNDSYV